MMLMVVISGACCNVIIRIFCYNKDVSVVCAYILAVFLCRDGQCQSRAHSVSI